MIDTPLKGLKLFADVLGLDCIWVEAVTGIYFPLNYV